MDEPCPKRITVTDLKPYRHMNQATTLYFPDTICVPDAAARLLLFFDKMYYYLPAESGPTAAGDRDLLQERGLCQGYVPAPLGSDLDRFNRTVRDLQTNLYEYGERLQHLAAASFAAGKIPDLDEISVSSLVAAMSSGPGPRVEKPAQLDDRQHELWQSRIILKLAEGYDRDKEEIDARLAKLVRSEQVILASLKGEDEDERFADLPLPGPVEGLQTKADPLRQRMRAWTSLFLADANKDLREAPAVLSTSRGDVIALLLEAYTERTQRQAGILLSLPVPGRSAMPAETLIAGRDAFRAEVREVFDSLLKLLEGAAVGRAVCPADAKKETLGRERLAVWTEALRHHFPSPVNSQGLLTVYCLENTPLAGLLAQTFLPSRHRRSVTDRRPTVLIAHLNME
jgi:hypothetical protein